MEVEDATMMQVERYCLTTFDKLTIMNQRAVVCRKRSSAHTVGLEERGAGVEYVGSKATRSRISISFPYTRCPTLRLKSLVSEHDLTFTRSTTRVTFHDRVTLVEIRHI